MNCLACRKHSLMIVCVYGFAKTELTCWAIKGGKPIDYNPEEVGTYVATAPDWCPLAKKKDIK